MAAIDLNSILAPIERLFRKNIRYSTVIDVGCADGHFFLSCKDYFPGAVPLHIDANQLYEESLKAIKDVVGGDYRISAITDRVGEIEITQSVHPYWSSVRPAGDPYWERVNDLITTTTTVPTTTLDTLVKELGLKPPFLLKLDVQGAEQSVLAGARDVLAETHVVICEADIDDFDHIHQMIVDAGMVLYDLTALSRTADSTLGWFYPIYVNRKLEQVRPHAFWTPDANEAIIAAQVERRKSILQFNAQKLNRIRYGGSKVGRNDPCPCGSEKRFKHCCGAFEG